MHATLRTLVSVALWGLAAGSFNSPAGVDPAGREGAEKTPSYLTPRELMKLAESSKVEYVIKSFSELKDAEPGSAADLLWPSRASAPPFPRVIDDADGGRSLSSFDFPEACADALRAAEPLFQGREYEAALKLYRDAAGKFPDCYLAVVNAGDALLFDGKAAEALPWYERALEVNPFDYRNHFYRANALLSLGRNGDAVGVYARALALSPRNENVLKVLRSKADVLGLDLHVAPFAPRALVRREGEKIGIYVDASAPHWLVYGLCKGIWLGEPEHRRRQGADPNALWSSVEETECLASMLDSYVALRDESGSGGDPEMERLLRILEDGLLEEFVLYEMGTRMWPAAVLTMPDAEIGGLERFVRAHVLRPKGEASQGPRPLSRE